LNNPHNSSLDPVMQSFLTRVAAPMRRMPAEKQEALLLEVRTHLETLVEDYTAQGMSMTKSVAAATKMMGDPKSLGRTYAATWYRAKERGTFWQATTVAGIVLVGVEIINHFIGQFNKSHVFTAVANQDTPIILTILFLTVISSLLLPCLTGWISGAMTPRNAVKGLVTAISVYACIYMPITNAIAWPKMQAAIVSHMHGRSTFNPFQNEPWYLLVSTIAGLFVMLPVALITQWAAKQYRVARFVRPR
jgi:hypothetical protein